MINKIYYIAILALFLFNFFLIDQRVSFLVTDELEITFLNVGQGDSILIKTPNNSYGLIDTGKGSIIMEELSETLPFFTKTFNFVILTHPDADHVEGFLGMIDRYEFKNIFIEKVPKESSIYEEILERIGNLNTNLYSITDLNDFELDGVTFDILWPQKLDLTEFEEDVNESSIALTLNYKDFVMYSAGDLGEENELKSIDNLQNKEVDVLKVGHHGSETSTSSEFLKATNVKVGVISVGKNNSYNHPNAETISELKEQNANIYRTDRDGRIKIKTNGSEIFISSQYGKMLEINAN